MVRRALSQLYSLEMLQHVGSTQKHSRWIGNVASNRLRKGVPCTLWKRKERKMWDGKTKSGVYISGALWRFFSQKNDFDSVSSSAVKSKGKVSHLLSLHIHLTLKWLNIPCSYLVVTLCMNWHFHCEDRAVEVHREKQCATNRISTSPWNTMMCICAPHGSLCTSQLLLHHSNQLSIIYWQVIHWTYLSKAGQQRINQKM